MMPPFEPMNMASLADMTRKLAFLLTLALAKMNSEVWAFSPDVRLHIMQLPCRFCQALWLKRWIRVSQRPTRLLGRPQPQMYPPVSLNQYTFVNKTFFYICLKAPQTIYKRFHTKAILSTLKTYVQLGKTIDNKFFICENINILAIWGQGEGFNNQTWPILVHIYSLFNNNLYVKYRSNLIRTF